MSEGSHFSATDDTWAGKLSDFLSLMFSSAPMSHCFGGLRWSGKVTLSQAKRGPAAFAHCPSPLPPTPCLFRLQGKLDKCDPFALPDF